ncbi:MAG: hypothetical protein JWN70_3822 [Planctomycetaceae bacterium]|nr:hypothetical protein [Planctomycetaceae bacterium]
MNPNKPACGLKLQAGFFVAVRVSRVLADAATPTIQVDRALPLNHDFAEVLAAFQMPKGVLNLFHPKAAIDCRADLVL